MDGEPRKAWDQRRANPALGPGLGFALVRAFWQSSASYQSSLAAGSIPTGRSRKKSREDPGSAGCCRAHPGPNPARGARA